MGCLTEAAGAGSYRTILRDNISVSQHSDPPTIYDDLDTLLDVKTLGPGLCYHKRNQQGCSNPVELRQQQVNTEYHSHAQNLDVKYNTAPDMRGRVTKKLNSFGKDGKVAGLVCGSFGECSTHVHQLALLVSKHEANNQAMYVSNQQSEIKILMAKSMKAIKNLWGLIIHRGWARLLINRTV